LRFEVGRFGILNSQQQVSPEKLFSFNPLEMLRWEKFPSHPKNHIPYLSQVIGPEVR
jgi:hypothetical protein